MRQPQVQLGKSPTQPKVIFRGVYGQPVFTRMRTQRMREAAQLLIHTDRSIGEIAEMSGYTNAGKFAAAFQDVMGETPREFRQTHAQQRKKAKKSQPQSRIKIRVVMGWSIEQQIRTTYWFGFVCVWWSIADSNR